MRARSTAPFVFAVIAAAAAMLGARQNRESGVGTAVLSGTLLTDAATPQPVRRAVVRLAGATGTSVRLAGTDDQGRFVFPDLPAGSFSLSATKIGYVPAFHGSKRPGRGPGVPIAIADGQRVAVTLKMLAGAVITGTIIDSRGKPVSRIPVVAVRDATRGRKRAAARACQHGRPGVYRIFGLGPGDYIVSALPRFTTGRGEVAAQVLGVTDAEAQWARGPGTSAGFGAAMPPPGRPVTYAPVYFPGTTDARAAVRVSVAAGEERTNVGFPLQIVTTSKITGTLTDHTGQPVTAASVSLYPRKSGQLSVPDALIAAARWLSASRRDGVALSIAGVRPATQMVARTGSSGRATAASPTPAQPTLWNVLDLTVDGRDQTDLVVRLQPGTTIAGSIVFDRSTLAAPADLSGLDLSILAVDALVGAPAAPRAVIEPAGAFRFSSVVPGTYAMKATPPLARAGARWTLKSVVLNRRDLADVLLDVKPRQDITGMVISSPIASRKLPAS